MKPENTRHKRQFKYILPLTTGLAGLYMFFLANGSVSQTVRPGEESYKRGRAFANNFECAMAIKEFDRGINVNPNDPRYYLGRAKCRLDQLANINANGEDVKSYQL
ncbi:MAG TPA: hypothetical protein PKD24_11480 [Pyrinomonadaceae bacterium]|nr:hypothetical protein [Pyrinomonadaceae bacterium]HMP66137.1 hypothetical protein [Pyrinomonadaceae bacterium]